VTCGCWTHHHTWNILHGVFIFSYSHNYISWGQLSGSRSVLYKCWYLYNW